MNNISWMMIEHFVTQGLHGHVGVYLRSADALMSQQGLNDTQVGTAFQQRRGKGVAQGVGRDGLLDASLLGLCLQHDEHHHTRQVCPSAVQEDIILLARLYLQRVAPGQIVLYLPQGRIRRSLEPLPRIRR